MEEDVEGVELWGFILWLQYCWLLAST